MKESQDGLQSMGRMRPITGYRVLNFVPSARLIERYQQSRNVESGVALGVATRWQRQFDGAIGAE